MKKLRMTLSGLCVVLGLAGPTLFTTAAHASVAPVQEQDQYRVLYDCDGSGFLQTEKCGNNVHQRKVTQSNEGLAKKSIPMKLAGYYKTYRCTNGWQVTHLKYCPDSGYNN